MAFEYHLMEPPFEFSSLEEMNEQQVSVYFDWFVGSAPERIELLRTAYARASGKRTTLDMTPESLVPLWKWLCEHVSVRRLTKSERTERQAMLPQWARDAGIQNQELSTPSLALAVDAGFYLAGLYLQEYPDYVRWAISRFKQDRNRPVLIGFDRGEMIPHELIIMQMWGGTRDEQQDDDLLRVYRVWERRLLKSLP